MTANGCWVNKTHARRRTARRKRYIRISRGPQRGRYVHQLVAEAMLGRPLRAGECVDHIDGISLNNAAANLRVCAIAGNSRRGGPRLGETILDGRATWLDGARGAAARADVSAPAARAGERLSLRQAARRAGVDRAALRRWLAEAGFEIPRVPRGSKLRISPADIESAIAARTPRVPATAAGRLEAVRVAP